jgi:hypothetical protein
MKWNVDIKVPNSRAAGAAGLFLGLVILICGGLFFTKAVVDAQYAELAAKTTQLEALQRRLKMPVLPAAAGSDESVFLTGLNYALAANSLQQHLVELVEQSGGKIVTVAVETPASTEQTSRRVIIQIRSELDNDGLQSLLYGLESGRPLVLIDSLNVHRVTTQGAGEKDDTTHSPRLTVELRAVGFYRGARS